MKVRIAFRSDIVIEGETMEQIREKWGDMPLYSEEARKSGVEFIEIDAVEEAETNHNLRHEFEQC